MYDLIVCALVLRDLVNDAATIWIQRRERFRRRSNLQNNLCVESAVVNFPLRGGGVECMIGKSSAESVSDSSEEAVGMQGSDDVDAIAR